MPKHEGLYISYYQYNTYKTCPAIIGFWSSHPRPETDKRNAMVGSCIHDMAMDYLREKIKFEDFRPKTKSYFDSFANHNIVEWRGKRDRVRTFEELIHNVDGLIKFIERFDIKPSNCQSELPVKVVIDDVTFAGRIDIVQATTSRLCRIFDFKATPKFENHSVDQMLVYFAMLNALGFTVEEGRFLFTSLNREDVVPFNQSEVKDLTARMKSVAQKIKEGKLEMLPSAACRYCDYRTICPGSAISKRTDKSDTLFGEVSF